MKDAYLSEKVAPRDSRNGRGLFAIEKIRRNEIISDSSKGTFQRLSAAEAKKLPPRLKPYLFQIEKNQYLATSSEGTRQDADFINHSCSPNCGIRESLKIVAMRDIEVGEEISYDYAMNESAYAFTLHCRCGSSRCRKIVTGLDWYRKDLQKDYAGYFSDYLQKRLLRPKWFLKLTEVRDRMLRFLKLRLNSLKRQKEANTQGVPS